MNDLELKKQLATMYNLSLENIEISFCPYRVCPIGAHIDHQKGMMTGFAINYGISIAYVPSNSSLFEITSMNFPETKKGDVEKIPPKQNDWADYLRGAIKYLKEEYGIKKGVYALINGDLPPGGISSSAAVIISFIKAMCLINGVQLTKDELIDLALRAETNYVGVSVGILDQSCEILCKENHLLHLDVKTGEYHLIPTNEKMKPYEFAIFFSGVKRTLVNSGYNTRVDELKSASYALKAFANMPYGKFNESVLRDVPKEVFQKYGDKLPLNWYKRANHFYSEMDRVIRGVKAFEEGDIEEYGRLSFASGDSSINNFETGSDELNTIYEIMLKTKGIYGGRFSGAGFKGCCVGIIDPDYEDSIKEKVTCEYLKKFPQYKDQFQIYFCKSANGCNLDGVLKDKQLVLKK